jgi:peptidoglycan/LPS O-acetylase OafA/YrhL
VRLVALDLVRFIAALSVVMYHYTARHESNTFEMLSEVTKFGYLGVPLFFMISGYVITLSANNRTAFEFAISRFVRLYPAFWAGIAFTLLVTLIYGQNDYSIAQILTNLTMLNDYLGYKNIDVIYWTLQAELKFYACVFLLLLFGLFQRFRWWLSIWLALTVLHLFTKQPFFMGWFISPFYSSFFIAGVAFYLIQKNGANSFNLIILFSSLFVSSFRGFGQALEFMRDPGTLNQSIAVILIWFFYITFYVLVTEKIRLSKSNYYLTLGGLTYPLYLIHNTAGKTIIDSARELIPEGVAVTATIMLMLLFSYLIHIGIEKKVATPIKLKLLNALNAITALAGRSNRTP